MRKLGMRFLTNPISDQRWFAFASASDSTRHFDQGDNM